MTKPLAEFLYTFAYFQLYVLVIININKSINKKKNLIIIYHLHNYNINNYIIKTKQFEDADYEHISEQEMIPANPN